MQPNSYVICKRKEEKPFLARIEKIKEGSVLVALQKDIQYQRNVVEVSKKEIKAMLGVNPLPGRVHGFDLNNLYRKTIEHDFWGPIHFFISPEKEIMKLLKTSLDRTAKIVDKLGLSAFTDCFQTEIRAKTGKFAGMYKHCASESKPNIVWYAPEWAKGAQNPQEQMDYVVLHEFGHVVRFNGIRTNKMRNRWLRLYQKTIQQVKVKGTELDGILADIQDFDEEQESFNSALNGAMSDRHPRYKKALLQWLKETHKIGPRELEIMWRSSGVKDIGEYWPDHMIDTHDLKPRVTEYATKSVEELFAECFAFYAQKKKLPDVCVSLMEESLSRAKVELNGK